jgi:hypothetical protein
MWTVLGGANWTPIDASRTIGRVQVQISQFRWVLEGRRDGTRTSQTFALVHVNETNSWN